MSTDWGALASGALALCVGLALVSFVSKRLKLDSGALLVAILFAPAILYLGLSGRLVEFKGLGLEAKFQAIAARQVSSSAKVSPIAPSASEVRGVEEAKSLLGMGANVVFVSDKDRADKRVMGQEVAPYARRIVPGLLDGSFEVLVVIDEKQKVLGYFPRTHFLDLLRIVVDPISRGSVEKSGVDYLGIYDALMQTKLWDIIEYPRIRADNEGQYLLVESDSTNAQALSKMNQARQEVAVLVDGKGIYAGIVRRSDIVAELLSATTK
jgi:hypothetical protein